MALNQCAFIGNVGKDPEIKSLQDGTKVANLSLGVSERWKDKATGEQKEKTEWVRVTVWGPLAGVVDQYVKKGHKLYISGKLQTRKWQNKEGVDQYTTEIVLQGFDAKLEMLTGRNEGGSAPAQSQASQPRSQPNGYAAASGKAPAQKQFVDDEIPF